MDKALRNTLRNVVTHCRKTLEDAIAEILQGRYGIHKTGAVEKAESLTHLSSDKMDHRERVVAHLKHIDANTSRSKHSKATNDGLNYEPAAVEQLIREAAFTHLNRLCAYKMMAHPQRQLIEDPVGKVLKSRGFLFYLADHPEDEALYTSAQAELAYRHFLEWQNENLSTEIGVLFSKDDVASGLFPPHRTLEAVLEKLNQDELKNIWAEDETIGWIFQYFTPKELRDKARKESAAPRNSYEMSFRNQFFTPRYVVEFLVDNTLGRTWYEMRDGDTVLKDECRYLAESPELENVEEDRKPTDGQNRPKKDPREIKVLDPACGSGHFLLYCFDLLQLIYEEAYSDSELGPKLQQDFPNFDEFKRQIPVLILTHNIHGIDIDLRVTQLAGLALWLRAQRAFQEMGLKGERPQIKRMNLICAEPMPGETDLLEEFLAELYPHPLGELIGQLVRNVFERMKLAGETGALLRIEDDISGPIDEARKQWQEMLRKKTEGEEELAKKGALFDYRKEEAQKKLIFNIADITSERVWHDAEEEALKTLREFAKRASNGKGLSRRLFADDAEQGFAFIDLCRRKFDVVLMNPPFGDASVPSKPYIDEMYGDTKGDVYKAFVECFQDRLVPGGFLGIISSRTGFFLSSANDWRERIVLRLYRPILLADFGIGVLDAMVETAAYVLRSLRGDEDSELTLSIVPELKGIRTDKNGFFSTRKYEESRNLKRHQATAELRRLQCAGFINSVEGSFPKWEIVEGKVASLRHSFSEPYPPLICVRLIRDRDKGNELLHVLQGSRDSRYFKVDPQHFKMLPNGPFVYWVPKSILSLFMKLELYGQHGEVKQGLATKDNDRFVRLWWEVSPADLQDGRWRTYAKGGAYAKYYLPLLLVVDWSEKTQAIYKQRTGQMVVLLTGKRDRYLDRRGLTYSKRSQVGFSARAMPRQSIFSPNGPGVFPENEDGLYYHLAILNSDLSRCCIEFLTSFGSYSEGYVESLPYPKIVGEEEKIVTLAKQCTNFSREIFISSELLREFTLPHQGFSGTIASLSEERAFRLDQLARNLESSELEINSVIARNINLSPDDQVFIRNSVENTHHSEQEESENDELARVEPLADVSRSATIDLLSYSLGCAFGRWDVRFATGEMLVPELPDPFAPLPISAPGTLTGKDGLPVSQAPEGYPLRVTPDGILVDDSTHADDLTIRAREVFELIWPKAAEAREREACELLSIKELRDYFRRPTAGGFWMDHVKRYSKSRRKAPIYWLLRSAKGNYSIWLYYHRLDKDILYKALVNYVEPKLRLEENKLSQLQQRRETVGTTGREAKLLEKDLDKQESFISELHDFHSKLKRAADLHLEPDLNDGVVLNIAPLHELVPWTEAKKYWKELTEGKYEWSTISKQLRERGMIRK